jgi:peptide methionine sulfoxide reductase MsrB
VFAQAEPDAMAIVVLDTSIRRQAHCGLMERVSLRGRRAGCHVFSDGPSNRDIRRATNPIAVRG